MAKTLGTEQHKALISMLIARREAVGMTQTELAKQLGEYQSFIARLESGQRRVDVIELIQIADVLGFTASQVVNEIESMGPQRWLAKFEHRNKWNFCLNSAIMPRNRRDYDEAYPP